MKSIRHVHSGFLGHQNDAGRYQQIGPIEPGQHWDFPAHCYLLAGGIYPNEHPSVTAYTSAEIVQRKQCVNNVDVYLLHKQGSVYVEHVIKEIKTYRIIDSLYRHPRRQMDSIVEVCVVFSKRHNDAIALF